MKQNKYLKNTKGDHMGPNTEILRNFLRIISLRERPGPKLRQIVEVRSISFQSLEIIHEQIHST